MFIKEVLKMYNEDGLTLGKIAEFFGVSKTSVKRLFDKHGYILDKDIKKYVKQIDITEIQINANKEIQESLNTGNKETVKEEINKAIKTVKCTFDLPQDLHRQLKSKCALDGVKMVDYVRDLIEKSMH